MKCGKNINSVNCSYLSTTWCSTHLGDQQVKLTHWLGHYLLARAEHEKRGCNIQIYDLYKHTLNEVTPILGIHINYESWEPLEDKLNQEFWIKHNKKETFLEFLCSREISKYKKKFNKKIHSKNPYYYLGMFDQLELPFLQQNKEDKCLSQDVK